MISKDKVEAIYSLSPMQEGMLFHTAEAPGAGYYIAQMDCVLRGELDVPCFRRAWQKVMERHAVLRTAFPPLSKKAQIVFRGVGVPLTVEDWRDCPPAIQQERLRKLLEAELQRGFDVSKAPLFRLHLAQITGTAWYFVCNFHHALLDGWSYALLLREVAALYAAYCQGRELELPTPPKFSEYIAWLQKQGAEAAKTFWQKKLQGVKEATPLPFVRSSNAGTSEERSEESLVLSRELSRSVVAFAGGQGLTTNTLFQAAWALVLGRHSGEEDVVFGATVAGRPPSLAGVEDMIGLFINTLPVRTTLNREEGVLDWLKRLLQEQVEAREYEYSSLVDIQGWSEIPRGKPLFNCTLAFENFTSSTDGSSVSVSQQQGASALRMEGMRHNHKLSYSLALIVSPVGRFHLMVRYDSVRFSKDEVRRLLRHVNAALEAMVGRVEQRLSEVNLLSEEERRQVVEEWNRSGREYRTAKSVVDEFEREAGEHGDAIALVYEEEQLSWGELNRRASQIGHYLQDLGVGPEVRVGLCVERSAEMVVGLLGVLKAGGAYVALEASQPVERLSYMLEDAQVAVVLTHEKWRARLPVQWAQVVTLDGKEWRDRKESNPEREVEGENLAYVIYTSGSTGRPKGVGIEQRQLRNYVEAVWERMELEPGRRMALVSTLGADLGHTMLYPALCKGGELHVVSEERGLDPRRWVSYCEEQELECVKITPTQLEMLLSGGGQGGVPHELVVIGGEASRREWVEGVRERGGKRCVVVNHYGPTECCVGALTHEVEKRIEGEGGMQVALGRPLGNMVVYVVDGGGELSPLGAPGELWIGGAGVARGYVNQAGMTAERFVPDGFSGAEGARLYRTGDRVRWTRAGELEFLGRVDEQVKVRGYRVEPGEIAAVLQQHVEVEQAVVVVREDVAGEKRLVGYVVLKGEGRERERGQKSRELREYVRSRLPEYMAPAAVVELEQMPLTPNGKLDSKALPRPEAERGVEEQEGPRTAMEELLCGIWGEVLRRERVGREENFFELGGHSLLATQVISRVREVLGVEAPLRVMFESPTVAGLAEEVERLRGAGKKAAPPMRRVDRGQGLPLSFAQQRLWFIDQLEPGSSAYNIPSAVRIRGRLEEEALRWSLEQIVKRHEVLRTGFETIDGEAMQRVKEAAAFGWRVWDLGDTPAGEREKRVRELVEEDARRPFDLARGPLLRVGVMRLEEQDHVLLLNLHHIVSDGWSSGILVREFVQCYEAYIKDEDPALPELPIQYGDFAVWQREWLRGEVLEEKLRYWRDHLEGAGRLDLPTDYVRPPVASQRGAEVRFRLPAELSARLKELSGRAGVTLFMTLLAGYQLVLARWSGQQDVTVGTPIANRNRLETEGLIGLFMNTLALRTKLSGQLSFWELLKQVRQMVLEGYEHQDVPFEKLVEELEPERDMGRTPLFQAMLILQNAPRTPARLPDLEISWFPAEQSAAKFDLTAVVGESAQGLDGLISYATDLFTQATVKRLMEHWQLVLENMVAHADQRISEVVLLSKAERRQLEEWNETERACPEEYVQEMFAAQARLHPERIAVVHGKRQWSYQELERRANQLARYLQGRGVGLETAVGLCLERSAEMVLGILGVLKAGGAYVPIDPGYPAERMRYMVEDAQLGLLLGQSSLQRRLEELPVETVWLDSSANELEQRSAAEMPSSAGSENLAYVIYTSGSTGKPKGVGVSHGSLNNFLASMEDVLGEEGRRGAWLAVTNYTFDISILEMLWSLSRGLEVVVAETRALVEVGADREKERKRSELEKRGMDFSLFYFASDDGTEAEKYRLLLEGARFADRNDFSGVWTPERHFHAFGGIYPNPAVTGAAVAAITERIQIRAGSVVLPLQNPLRVAEEWSVVDNLSRGRAAISFASGWQPNDFVLAPQQYQQRKEVMLKGIEVVRNLWRGEGVRLSNGVGQQVEVRIHPRPVQAELPYWLTSSGSTESFRMAGEMGAGLLTHLLGQSVEELGEKIAVYREAWQKHGHAGRGWVSLMIHTFMGEEMEWVKEKVRRPFSNYLTQSVDLVKGRFARGPRKDVMSPEDIEAVTAHAFERYFEKSGLMGTPESCLETIGELKAVDVDEVACLIDFGVDAASVLKSLELVNELRMASNRPAAIQAREELVFAGRAAAEITHLQCTPSMARLMLASKETRPYLGAVRQLLLGGEALPAGLVRELRGVSGARIYNMYGPTETTIWSAVKKVQSGDERNEEVVSIGRPLGNTQLYVVDESGQLAPIGAPGELWIGGQGLARGYVNQAGMTAERFVPDGWSGVEGGRLYRTGDRARWKQNGELEFLGRADHQVKVRGYRIELGEIEAVLEAHAEVERAVVLAVDGGSGEKQLVGYVVRKEKGEEKQSKRIGELRAYLRGKLPEYMVPGVLVEIEEVPLTANGKLDRKALLAAGAARVEGDGYVGPRDAEEEILCGIWAEMLRRERVGVEENFFHMGGHSLLAVRVISRVQELLGVDIALRVIFETPTVAGLVEEIRKQRGAGKKQQPAMRPADRDRDLPLSFAQQRMWFIHQLEPEGAAYNVPFAARLCGKVREEVVRKSFARLVQRHEALRTRFEVREEQPVQVIEAEAVFEWTVWNLRTEAKGEREAEAWRLMEAHAVRPFDLQRGPVLRAGLIQLADEEFILLLVTHHIVSDGWSSGILVREFVQCYEAYNRDEEPELAELPIQYADYAVWQREWLRGAVLEEQLAYWRKELADVERLELPTDHQRPAVASHRGQQQRFLLESELTERVRDLSRQRGVTLFMALLGAWQMVLGRYAGQAEVVVGTDVAGRNRLETEGLIGFFINQLVLRADLASAGSFAGLLQQVRQRVLEAYEHQDVPFEKLVEELEPERDLGRAPLFQVKLVLQNAARMGETGRISGVKLEGLDIPVITIKLDLNLMLFEREDGLAGVLHYATDLFEAETVRRLTEYFQRTLEAMVEGVEQDLGEVSLLNAAERRQLVEEWNRSARGYGQARSVVDEFEREAGLHEDAIALVYEEEQMSWGKLNRRANQVGHYLQELGVGPEVRVGLCVERSAEMVVGMLGVLKAGGAYVAMEGSLPVERLSYMLENAQVAVALTQGKWRARLPVQWAQVVTLDEDGGEGKGQGEWREQPESNPQREVEAENLAYVIYTSGSTGRPKGVGVEQRQLRNYVEAVWERLSLEPGRRMALVSTLGADLGHTMLYPALCKGGELHVVSEECGRDPQLWVRYCQERELDCVKITPTQMETLLSGGEQGGVPHELVVIGGEASRREWVESVRERGGERCVVVNHYGPTECCVGVLTQEVEKSGGGEAGPVALGRPLGNMVVYVVDRGGELAPLGAPGELWIGGAGVARGYVNQAGQTGERFVPDGFSGVEGARLYRTGDRVRWRREGALEFLGRVDEQVKVRGYRVEPGEIAAVLEEHVEVEQAAVVVREEAGERRLVGYVVLKDEGRGKERGQRSWELREYVRSRLPEYMVPAAVVELEQIPLTANGKLDRKALPSATDEDVRDVNESAPRDSTEVQLLQLWKEVLGLENIGITDNFFALGGHSLTAVSLAARLSSVYEERITVRSVFEFPTIALMSSFVRQEVAYAPPTTVIPIQPKGHRTPIFCVHPAQGMPHCYLALARHLGPDQPFYAMQSYGLEEGQLPYSDVESMAARYIEDMRKIQPSGPYQLGGWSLGGIIAYEMAQQLHASGEKIGMLVMLEAHSYSQQVDAPLTEEQFLLQKRNFLLNHLASDFGVRIEDQAVSLDSIAEMYFLRAKDSGQVPTDVTMEQFQRLLLVTIMNRHAARKYIPRPYPGSLTLFRSTTSRHTKDDYGWSTLVMGKVDVHCLDAEHNEFVMEPNAAPLARSLAARMSEDTESVFSPDPLGAIS